MIHLFTALISALILLSPLPAAAQIQQSTYSFDICVDITCGDTRPDDDIQPTDALIAGRIGIFLPSLPGDCEYPMTDTVGMNETLILDPSRSINFGFGSHGIGFLGSCGDVTGDFQTTATDANAVNRVAVGLGYPNSNNTCNVEFVDPCFSPETGPFGIVSRLVKMDKEGQGDGQTCATFTRYTLDECDTFTNRLSCIANNVIDGANRRMCRWVNAGFPVGDACFPINAGVDRCLQAQRDGGIQ